MSDAHIAQRLTPASSESHTLAISEVELIDELLHQQDDGILSEIDDLYNKLTI